MLSLTLVHGRDSVGTRLNHWVRVAALAVTVSRDAEVNVMPIQGPIQGLVTNRQQRDAGFPSWGALLGSAGLVAALLCGSPVLAQSGDAVPPGPASTILVLDASGSMWQQVDGTPKIALAREVVGQLLDALPADQALGLWAYGHNRKGDCEDIEALVPVGTDNRAAIRAAVAGVNPKGMTPLSDAVRQAAEALRYEEDRAVVVLVSDGAENCDRDPCAVATALATAGIDFTAHVIGFDVSAPADQAQLRCLAENTGGSYRSASDAATLKDALIAVTVAPEPEPEPEPEPTPAPAPEPVTLRVPATAPAGAPISVGHDARAPTHDIITIVRQGTADKLLGNQTRVRDPDDVTVQAPGEAGLYEVRYVKQEGRAVLGRAPIELTATPITLTAPTTATAGARIAVTRDRTVMGSDFITIVPVGTADNVLGGYTRARDNLEVSVQAPAEPGRYEVRYVLGADRIVAGRAPIELLGAALTLDAPATVSAGERFEVTRDGTVKTSDYITIVPMGTAEGKLGTYNRTRDKPVVSIEAPAEPGLYEVRYVLDAGRGTLARRPLEVVPVTAAITAPAEVVTGASIDLAWQGPGRSRDRVELVVAGAPLDATPLAEARADNNAGARFVAPDAAGLYQLRYRLGRTGEIVTSSDLEVQAVAASLNAPERAAPGETIRVGWTGPAGERDRIAIASPDQGPFQWASAVPVVSDEGDGITLSVPLNPGSYEVRYVDVANGVVLASHAIVVESAAAE